MQLTLQLLGGSTYDVTGRLSADVTARVKQESKASNRDRFLADVHLVMANHDDYFSNLFKAASPTARWWITIRENSTTVFRGEIQNETIVIDPGSDWAEWDVFSLEKVFLEIAGRTKVLTRLQPGETGRVYTSLSYILERELLSRYRTDRVFRDYVLAIDAGEFANDSIRMGGTNIYTSLSPNTIYQIDRVTELGVNYAAAGITTEAVKGYNVTAYYVPGGLTPPVRMTGIITSVHDPSDTIFVDRWRPEPATEEVTIPTNGSTYKIGISPTIGLEGRWNQLDPSTTVKELLLTIAGEKNAEFFIDPDTLTFRLQPRRKVIRNRASTEGLNIDDRLLQETTPKLSILEEERYDYVRLEIGEPTPPTPLFNKFIAGGTGVYGTGLINYAMTLVFSGGYESIAGGILGVANSGIVTLPNNLHEGSDIELKILSSGIPGVTARRLYRSDLNDEEGRLRFLAEIAGDAETTYRDATYLIYIPDDPNRPANEAFPPQSVRAVGMWLRFDPVTSLWADPIVDTLNGEAVPYGKILEDTVPRLRFIDLNDQNRLADNQPLHLVKFFAQEAYGETHRERWKPFFLKARGVRASMRGIDYAVGDSIIAGHKLFNGDAADDVLIVTSAAIDLVREFSDLVMVTK